MPERMSTWSIHAKEKEQIISGYLIASIRRAEKALVTAEKALNILAPSEQEQSYELRNLMYYGDCLQFLHSELERLDENPPRESLSDFLGVTEGANPLCYNE